VACIGKTLHLPLILPIVLRTKPFKTTENILGYALGLGGGVQKFDEKKRFKNNRFKNPRKLLANLST
jgi:hypothetical protein